MQPSSGDYDPMLAFPHHARVPFQGVSRLHLVVVVLVSCHSELVRDHVAHVHEVLQALVQDLVDIGVVWPAALAFARYPQRQHTVALDANVHLCLGRMRDRVAAELHIRTASSSA
jgi:hypothetical protein